MNRAITKSRKAIYLLAVTLVAGIAFVAGRQSSMGFQQKEYFANGRDRGTRRSFVLPLNNPDTVPAAAAPHMKKDDLVVGVIAYGRARAYPAWILAAYHVTNDTIDDKPLLLSRCEICSAAAAFIPESQELGSLTFEGCGRMAGTFEICDTATQSRWSPFGGIARSGYLRGTRLRRLPTVTQKWEEWKTAHPETDVVYASAQLKLRPHGHSVASEMGNAHLPTEFSSISNLSDQRLPANELVLGIISGKQTFAIPLRQWPRERSLIVRDFGGKKFLVVRTGEFALSAFPVPGEGNFRELQSRPWQIGDERGNRWDEMGQPVSGSPHAKPLAPADGYVTEWYEWVTSYPGSEIVSFSGTPPSTR